MEHEIINGKREEVQSMFLRDHVPRELRSLEIKTLKGLIKARWLHIK